MERKALHFLRKENGEEFITHSQELITSYENSETLTSKYIEASGNSKISFTCSVFSRKSWPFEWKQTLDKIDLPKEVSPIFLKF